MPPLQQAGFRFTQQFAQFGFQSLGQSGGTTPPPQNQLAQLLFFDFTKQFVQFKSLGQSGGTTPPPPGGVLQFLIGGPDLTEQFVTHGRISAGGVSYTINPLSRRTV